MKHKLTVPAIGQTFSRDLMPQIGPESMKDFQKYLKAHGIGYNMAEMPTGSLKATQSQFDGAKIIQLMGTKNSEPIITSNDDHVLDGHHRWLANHNSGKEMTKCCHVDLPVLELMRVAKEYRNRLNEELSHKDFGPMMDTFVSFASDKLGLKSIPKLSYKTNDDQGTQPSFGGYNPSSQEIIVCTKNRHPMDVFRTIAHELVHHKQNEDGKIKDVSKEGSTGSPIEDEANFMAGRLMRWYAKANPGTFELSYITESSLKEDLRKWFREKWVRFDTKGKIKGQCARDEGEGKPKCLPLAKARALGKEARAKAAKRKRREDPVADRSGKGGKPINVRTESVQTAIDKINRDRKKKVLMEKNVPTNPELWSKAKSLAKSKFDVYPSAYANGWASKWYKSKGGGWKSKVDESKNYDGAEAKQTRAIDKEFTKFLEEDDYRTNTYRREWGTTSLANMYKRDTPGQMTESLKLGSNTPVYREYEGMGRTALGNLQGQGIQEAIRKRKKKLEEDGVLDTASGAVGLPVSDSIGPEFGVAKSPSLIGGLVGVSSPVTGFGPAGAIYPYGTYGIAESVIDWMNKDDTQARFAKKYGNLAEQKLIETGIKLTESGNNDEITKVSKTFTQIRESWDARYGGRDMGTVPYSHAKVDEESPAWTRKEGQDPEGGLNRKGIASYRRANPGSKLSMAVTTKPSKLKKGSKAAKRRKSFCARMGGMKKRLTSAKTARDPDSRINKALRKWNCEE